MNQILFTKKWLTLSERFSISFSFKTLVYVMGGFVAVFNCYLYEQVFYECFIGDMHSIHRAQEWMVVISGFVLFCILLPIFSRISWFGLRKFYRQIIIISLVIPAGFVVAISFTSLSFYLGMPLKMASSLQPANVVIVADLGNFASRGQYGASLYHKGYAEKVVVFARKQEPYISFLEKNLKIPGEDIIWARKGWINTHIEALAIKKLFDDYGWQNALVVTDSVHMFRLTKALRKAGVKNILPASVPFEELEASPAHLLGWQYQALWDRPLQELSFSLRFKFRHKLAMDTLHEYVGIVFYFYKGYL